MAYLGRAPTDTGEFLQIDELSSSFDGSTRSFDLQIGTSPITPTKENVIVALDGVLQTAGDAYSVSGSTVTFAEAPIAGTSFYGILTGQVGASVANNAITDDHISGTTSISGSKIDTDFSAQVVKARVFDGMISGSAQIASSDSMTLATASIAAITASISTLSGTGAQQGVGTTNAVTFATVDTGQGANELYDMDQNVKTDSSPTFAAATITGTLTATEVHTQFVSASITKTTGSNVFGDEPSDRHQFTGSAFISSSITAVTGSYGRVEATNYTGDGSALTGIDIPTAAAISGSVVSGVSGSVTSTGSFGSTHVMGNLNIGTVTASPSASVTLGTSTSALTISGSIFPEGDNNHDLGSLNYRWAGIYTTDLELSNKGVKGNDIDGTSGHWTIQEGKENLYLINNETNKKFKFKLEEIE